MSTNVSAKYTLAMTKGSFQKTASKPEQDHPRLDAGKVVQVHDPGRTQVGFDKIPARLADRLEEHQVEVDVASIAIAEWDGETGAPGLEDQRENGRAEKCGKSERPEHGLPDQGRGHRFLGDRRTRKSPASARRSPGESMPAQADTSKMTRETPRFDPSSGQANLSSEQLETVLSRPHRAGHPPRATGTGRTTWFARARGLMLP